MVSYLLEVRPGNKFLQAGIELTWLSVTRSRPDGIQSNCRSGLVGGRVALVTFVFAVGLFAHCRRVILACNDILGHWEIEWNYSYNELREPPMFSAKNKGIQIALKVNTCVTL